jgi:signal transduction histidine kinase
MRTQKPTVLTRLWGLAASSLSGRLFALTLLFVLFSEIFAFAPAVGRLHRSLLENHILSAELAVMPFNESGNPDAPIGSPATPDTAEVQALKRSMLRHADAVAVTIKRQEFRNYYSIGAPPKAGSGDSSAGERTIDLNRTSAFFDAYNALDCLVFGGRRLLYVTAPTHIHGAEEIGVFLDEAPIRDQMVGFLRRVAANILFVSAFTAVLVFASLYHLLVRPMRRIVQSMAAFRKDPEDASRILKPSHGYGEIGQAENELAAMQRDLFGFLRQKARLAALGTAVARIQHDLRNILTTAQLASDRLATSQDPAVKRLTPSLVSAIDRAVGLATHTLQFVRAEESPLELSRFALARLIDEAAQTALGGLTSKPQLRNRIPDGFMLTADREQMFRVILNLVRNAAQAVSNQSDGTIAVSARRQGDSLDIDIEDNGPGIAPTVQDFLFQPFAAKTKTGGTGLGLAIARELTRGHGGELRLLATGGAGTVFRITIPNDKIANSE